MRAQVKAAPAAMAAAPENRETATGETSIGIGPVPSWPPPASPQQSTAPEGACTAQVWRAPTASATAFGTGTATGAVTGALSLRPSPS